ncbi:PAS domain-containing protein [Pseudomaricurvus alcaniphilus]|uniref:PAS domain-containing protein n=1 Tax=Pseudomaricurvus alcaniphilus TaxID=1166482 RepID=UPI00140D79E8|nr:PAS domain-containing protein [Pseudomaricurvus alcaniphilus]
MIGAILNALRGRRRHQNSAARCQNIYRFIRLQLGDTLSDREVARQWGMDWSGFAKLKSGARRLPRIEELDALATLLEVPSAVVFEVAMGVPAAEAHETLGAGYSGGVGLSPVHAWVYLPSANKRLLSKRVTSAEGKMDLSGLVIREAMFLLNADGVFLGYYEGHFAPYISPETFLGRAAAEVLPAGIAERMQAEVATAARGDEVRTLSYALPGPNGEQQFSARLIPLEANLVLGVVRRLECTPADDSGAA